VANGKPGLRLNRPIGNWDCPDPNYPWSQPCFLMLLGTYKLSQLLLKSSSNGGCCAASSVVVAALLLL